MGNTTATVLQKLRTEYDNGYLDNFQQDVTPKYHGAMNAMLDDTALIGQGGGILSPQDKENIARAGYNTNGAGVNVFEVATDSTSAAIPAGCTPTNETADTALFNATYTPLTIEFVMDELDYDDNYVSLDSALGRQLQSQSKFAKDRINASCLAALNTAKNEIQTGNTLGYWDETTTNDFIVQSAGANAKDVNQFYRYNYATMANMSFNPLYRVVMNMSHFAATGQAVSQGQANSVNYQQQIAGAPANFTVNGTFAGAPYNWYSDIDLANPAGILVGDSAATVTETQFTVPVGSTALIFAPDYNIFENPMQRSENVRVVDRGLTTLPFMPEDAVFAYTYQMFCDGNNRWKHSWIFETKYSIVTPYITDKTTQPSPINRFLVGSWT